MKRGRGRPPFVPTPEMRNVVGLASGWGLPQDQIALLITNPSTGKPINEDTLKIHFEEELKQGISWANLILSKTAYYVAVHDKNPSMLIFLLKCRLRFRTSDGLEELPLIPEDAPRDPTDVARRAVYLLESHAR